MVAAFDLDGTLTRHDTLRRFLRSAAGSSSFASATIRQAPSLFSGRAHGEKRDAAKEAFFGELMAGRSVQEVVEVAQEHARWVCAHGLRRDTVQLLAHHRRAGHHVVIVSASFRAYVEPIANHLGADGVLATDWELSSDGTTLTGRLLGRNMRGQRKADALREYLGEVPQVHWAYGNSGGDREMLAMSSHPVMVPKYRSVAAPQTLRE
jgi:phosphatidylglycerophosphatase C